MMSNLRNKGLNLKNKGFNLIELLAVLAVIAILSAGIAAYVSDGSSQAKTESFIRFLTNVHGMSTKYNSSQGAYCSAGDDNTVDCTNLKNYLLASLSPSFKMGATGAEKIKSPFGEMGLVGESGNIIRYSVVVNQAECKALVTELMSSGAIIYMDSSDTLVPDLSATDDDTAETSLDTAVSSCKKYNGLNIIL